MNPATIDDVMDQEAAVQKQGEDGRRELMDHLAAYIPMDRRFALAGRRPLPDRARGAALFADVSGFTQVSAALAEALGPQRGAEELTHHLDRVFGALIDEAFRYHGSVVSFAGDAIICWFEYHSGARIARMDAAAQERESARLALTCALAMQEMMQRLEAVTTPAGERLSLAVKISVTAGMARRFQVGDERLQRFDTLAGSLLDRLEAANKVAGRGMVVADQTVLHLLHDDIHQIPISTEGADGGDGAQMSFAQITAIEQPADPRPWPPAPALDLELTGQWIANPVLRRLQRGEGDFLSELRLACALFVRFSGIDYDGDEQSGEKLDAYIRWVGSVIEKHQGYLDKLTIGDKGSYLLAVFGAPQAHENDAALCTAAAVELLSPGADLDFIHSIQIGMSRGQIRSGAYGSASRRTYSVHGEQVNIAARLMMLAAPGQILATEAMALAAADFAEFQEYGLLDIRGLDMPLKAFEVCRVRHFAARSHLPAAAARAKGESAPIIGRSAERSRFAGQIRALQEAKSVQAIIEGEAGIGKSRLMEEFVAQSTAAGLSPLVGAGLAIEQTTPYHAWLPILLTLFEVSGGEGSQAMRTAVLDHLAERPDLLERAPLLNDLLPLGMPDNELTAAMSGEVRANNTLDLLVALLREAGGGERPMMIVIDDGHWLDSASWALVERVRRDLPHLLLLLVTRPMGLELSGRPAPAEYQRLLASPGAALYRLGPLSIEEAQLLAARKLGVRELPQAVNALIKRMAEGHPFYSEEIAFALRDKGLITVQDGQAVLTGEADLLDLSFPDTVQGVITSRIDLLEPGPELALKVASVIGRIFPLRTLEKIHPVEADRPSLPAYLETLARLDITPLETPLPEATYIFRHALTQDVAYSLLLYGQRRDLHRAVALWYESANADDLSHYYPLLAYHWGKSGDSSKTIDYLELAGEQALRNFANQEAVAFMTQALELAAEADAQDDRTAPPVPALRRAVWLRQLGQAYLGLGQLDDGRRALNQALEQAGYPAPATQAGLRTGLLGQVLVQLAHRLFPSRVIGRAGGDQRKRFLEVARAHQLLAEIYYFANERTQLLFAGLNVLNASEWAGPPSSELTRAYANMVMIAGLIPLHRLAAAYSTQALETAERTGDLTSLAWANLLIGTYQSGIGGSQAALEFCGRAREISREVSDMRVEGLALAVLGAVVTYLGRFEESRQIYSDWHDLAVESNNVQHQAMSLFGQGLNIVPFGEIARAVALFEQGIDLLSEEAEPSFEDRTTALRGYGQLALARLRLGDEAGALQAASESITIMRSISAPKRATFREVLSDMAQVYLTLWEKAASSDAVLSAEEAKPLAQESIDALKQMAGAFTICRPRLHLWQGTYLWLEGKPGKAREEWQKSLDEAQALGFPLDTALAHYEIGRFAQGDRRQHHLSLALEGFEALGASYYVEQVRSLLN